MVKKALLTLFFIFTSVCATNINLELQDIEIENGKNIVYVGEEFQIVASINDSKQHNEELQFYGLDNFKISGRSQSSSISIINGQMSAQTDYNYNVYAEKNGQFKIGPAFIMKGDKRIDSNVLNVVVKNRPAGQVVSSSTKKISTNINSNNHDYEVFCKLNVQDPKIVVGQPTLLTASVYTNGAILQMGLQPFKSSDLLVKEIEQVSTHQENVNGKMFNVSEKKYLITPLKDGEKEIKPLSVDFVVPVYRRKRLGMFGDDFLPTGFFGHEVEQKKVLSNTLKLDVISLPKYSGSIDGVGAFDDFELTVDKDEALINEPITVKIKLSGLANLEQITYPKLDIPSFCKYYESRFDTNQNLNFGLTSGVKIFEYVLQAGKSGSLKIPEQKFTYFDTKTHSYKTLQSKALDLNINLGEEGDVVVQNDVIKNDSLPTDEKSDELFKSDINFISEELVNKNNKFSLQYWLFLFFILLPIIIFYRYSIFKFRHKVEKKYFSGFAKLKNLNAFEKKLDNIIKKNQVEQLNQFYLNYLAFKYDLSSSEITQNFITQKLIDFGWSEEQIDCFLDYLSICASLHFAGKDSSFENKKEFVNKAKYWFEQLKEIREKNEK